MSSLKPPSLTPLGPTDQICSEGVGIFGAPCPNTRVDPGTTPPVITGAGGAGVGVVVGVEVMVGVGVGVRVLVGDAVLVHVTV